MRRRLLIGLLAIMVLAPLAPAQAIVNGSQAAPGAYPWMAAFLFSGGQGCGGSVVAPNWILTAAHCVTDDRGQLSVTTSEVSFRVNTTDWRSGGQLLHAAQIVVHPSYDPILTNHDVALVRTSESTSVTPVRLAGPSEAGLNAPPTIGRVIGYGTTSTGGPASNVLLEVDVAVWSDTDCANSGYGQLVPDNMVCAGDPTADSNAPGDDSCQGDSGGPLFATAGGQPTQFGIVSFGGECGVAQPGVYTQVSTYKSWIEGIMSGAISATDPDPGPASDQPTGADADPVRIAATDGGGDDPVANAIAISQMVYQQDAEWGVLAASAKFPDALGGTALSAWYGPLLFVNAAGQLEERTIAEFQRTLAPGSTVFVLGGPAVIPAIVDDQLIDAGFFPERLFGAERQETARIVAETVNEWVNGGPPPFDSVIVAYDRNWPDAVTVSQISAWFGIPVLLTPTASLGGPARQYLEENFPTNVFVVGGPAVVSDNTVAEIEAITGADSVIRLGGANRLQTNAQITLLNRYDLYPRNEEFFTFTGDPVLDPPMVVAVNLRRSDAFAHVLAASMLLGNFGGVIASVDGSPAGVSTDQSVLDSVCALGVGVLAIGSTTLVADAVLEPLRSASQGQNCSAG